MISVLEVEQKVKGGPWRHNDRFLAIAPHAHAYEALERLDELHPHRLLEIESFFTHYAGLNGKKLRVLRGPRWVRRLVRAGAKAFRAKHWRRPASSEHGRSAFGAAVPGARSYVMRVVIVGMTGFIGSAVAAWLHARGHEVVGISRCAGSSALPIRRVTLDIAKATTPSAWLPHLVDVDAVIYCAGLLQDGPTGSLHAVHVEGPGALYQACLQAGVRRVIHLSALGVEREATDFARTKLAGDRVLMASALDWIILRPSLVMGRGAYGGSALLRGLAALPLRPVMTKAGALQVVHLDDLLATIVFFLKPQAPSRLVLDLVGPKALAFDDLIDVIRRWLGWRPARRIPMPEWLTALLFRLGDWTSLLGWRSPIRSTARREIEHGATGDPSHWIDITGIKPRDLTQALMAEPASVQERWFSQLYLLKPWIFAIIALFWISTGIVALGPGWKHGVGLMEEGGLHGLVAPLIVIGGALCDIGVGCLIAWRPTARRGIYAGFAVTIIYALIGTALVPRLWVDPMGPMLKIFPILALHLAALAVVDDR